MQGGARGGEKVLGSLPRLLVCGGSAAVGRGAVSEVWGLNMATMRWKAMSALLCTRRGHACSTVRGALVVPGGFVPRVGLPQGPTSRVEMLSKGARAFVELPPLSCGATYGAAVIAVDESRSASGQVLLLGGRNKDDTSTSPMRLVDLVTGISTPQADLLNVRSYFAAARLPDRGIIRAGGIGPATVEMLERPMQGALDAAWMWRRLPAMSVRRSGCSGCMLSDGRFAVLGGYSTGACMSSCEALTLGDDGHWSPLPQMHDTQAYYACAAVAGCIIVAGGGGYPPRKTAEVYDEVLGRWLHDSPHDGGLSII